MIVPFGNDVINARDGEPDVIDCGVGNDTAYVDPVDTVANCETVNGAPAGGGPGVQMPGDGGHPAAACKVPKKLKGKRFAVAKKRLRAAHCRKLRKRKEASRSVRKGRVVRAVRRGRVVTVYVSRGRR